MKIIRADVLGYCMGVRRAVETVTTVLCRADHCDVYTMGPLIHNPGVLEKLKNKGLGIIGENDIDALPRESIVIIRAHGVPPSLYDRLVVHGCTVVDATCPRVKLSQKRTEEFSRKGYTIIFTGDKNHGEVAGIAGYAGSRFLLVRNREEAEQLFAAPDSVLPEKAVLLSQTTFSPGEFEEIAAVLRQKMPSLEIYNTICPATKERQDALGDLCSRVDGVLVIGGKNSANTRRLFENAVRRCKNTALIETAADVPPLFFSMNTVGITAGASTPDEVIVAVETKLQELAVENR